MKKLSTRARNSIIYALYQKGVTAEPTREVVGINLSAKELLYTPGCGRKTVAEIASWLGCRMPTPRKRILRYWHCMASDCKAFHATKESATTCTTRLAAWNVPK